MTDATRVYTIQLGRAPKRLLQWRSLVRMGAALVLRGERAFSVSSRSIIALIDTVYSITKPLNRGTNEGDGVSSFKLPFISSATILSILLPRSLWTCWFRQLHADTTPRINSLTLQPICASSHAVVCGTRKNARFRRLPSFFGFRSQGSQQPHIHIYARFAPSFQFFQR